MRGSKLQKARLGPYGVVGDRTFSIQKIIRNGTDDPRYETMFIGYHLQMALFEASVDYDSGSVTVKWNRHDTESKITTPDEVTFPLQPSTQGRTSFETSLHASKTLAYDMGDDLSQWFADRLGVEVRLAYIGNGSRPVLGSLAPNSSGGLKRAGLLRQIRASVPFLSYPSERLTFNDLAQYLVVTEESNNQVSSRFDDGHSMDITKFRPNIVVRGATGPFVEDFWAELEFAGGVKMAMTANCYRCQSITVDYKTGRTAENDEGMVWKKLNKDRRVDAGVKYSPVFGRYGYCFGSAVGRTLQVGQKAEVTRVNKQRTTFGEFMNFSVRTSLTLG